MPERRKVVEFKGIEVYIAAKERELKLRFEMVGWVRH